MKVQIKSLKKKVVRELGREKKKPLWGKLSNGNASVGRQMYTLKLNDIIDDTTENKLMAYTNFAIEELLRHTNG